MFKQGDPVICEHAANYAFTEGKEYTVVEYQPPERSENGFRWPAYLKIEDDRGKLALCHDYRFKLKE